jgi:hypothetical protein
MKTMISHWITQLVSDRIKSFIRLQHNAFMTVPCLARYVHCCAALPSTWSTHTPGTHAMTPHPRPQCSVLKKTLATSPGTYAQPSNTLHCTTQLPASWPDVTLVHIFTWRCLALQWTLSGSLLWPQIQVSVVSTEGLQGSGIGCVGSTLTLPCRPGTEGPVLVQGRAMDIRSFVW